MTIAGTVKNGVVVLDDAPPLADGTRVRVLLADSEPAEPSDGVPTLQGLLKLAGTVKGMPPDMAQQHDHYIHGTPKK
jgi:hypothetical protein